jgi:hypothetical protein
MTWKLIDRPKTLKVTKNLANEFATMDTIPNDRPLSERRLTVYRKLFAEGSFRPVTWAKCFCKETNTLYRVNGKHTSTLLSSMEEIPEFYVTIELYEAETLKETVELYNTFDSKDQTRTYKDINHSFAAVEPLLRDVPSRIIDTTISAVNYAEYQDAMWNISVVERAEKILDEDNVQFTLWIYNEIYADKPVKEVNHLLKAGVVAAMKLTWLKSQRASTEFWKLVRDETGIDPNLPDRKLAKFLYTTLSLNTPHGKSKAAKKANAHEYFVRSLHAWNAWRKGKPTKLSYFSEAEIPKVY